MTSHRQTQPASPRAPRGGLYSPRFEHDSCGFGLIAQMDDRASHWLVRTAVLTAWSRPGLERLCVNTCSLDHPRALANYQKSGFEVVAQESQSRVLTREHDPARIPE